MIWAALYLGVGYGLLEGMRDLLGDAIDISTTVERIAWAGAMLLWPAVVLVTIDDLLRGEPL